MPGDARPGGEYRENFFFFCASCWLPRVSVCLKEKVGDGAKNKITTSRSGCFFSSPHIKTEINFWERGKKLAVSFAYSEISNGCAVFMSINPTSCNNNNNNGKGIWIKTFTDPDESADIHK